MKSESSVLHKSRFLIIGIFLGLVQCNAGSDNLVNLDWRSYQNTICLGIFRGEIVLPALGHGRICGHPTPNCNQAYCAACAAGLGVCDVCGKKNNWTKNTDPVTEVPLLLAILKNSPDIEAKRVAVYALSQIKEPGTLQKLMAYSQDRMLYMQLAIAVGEFKDEHYLGFLQMVLHGARDAGDTELQYYIAQSAEAAAKSLAIIKTDKARNILVNAARHGRLWERYYALSVLGDFYDDQARQTLKVCLKEFFAKDDNWKWIPGRDLIGATLSSLSRNGDEEAARLVLGYIINPGCDFLYEDLRKCLSSIGQTVVQDIINAITGNLRDKPNDYANQILLEALGDIGDQTAVDFFISLVDTTYEDTYLERDIKNKALEGLGKLRAVKAIEAMTNELFKGKDEWTRQVAAQALGKIGGLEVFNIFVEKLEQGDGEWVTRDCLAGLNTIAFQGIGTAELKLKATKLTAQKSGFETAFQLMYQPVMNSEDWAIDYFFEIISRVPMQRNFYTTTELINTQNKKVFTNTVRFLKKLTKLPAAIKSSDASEKKNEYKQKLWDWFQKNYQTLN